MTTFVSGAVLTAAQLTALVPTGTIFIWSAAAAPDNFLLCDGSSLLRTTYSELFDVIGTTYGAADGTHFTLPDLRDQFVKGKNADALGATGGAATHTHPLSSAGFAKIAVSLTNARAYIGQSAQTFTATAYGPLGGLGVGSSVVQVNAADLDGTTDAGSTLPPYLTLNFIIRYQ